MIEAFLKAIFDKYSAANDFKTATGGRLYAYEAPENTAYPYCVFEQISGIPDRTFTEKGEDVLIQFALVDKSDSVATIADAESKMHALFDDAVLSITGYSFTSMTRESSHLMKLESENDDKQKTWNIIATYRLLADKT